MPSMDDWQNLEATLNKSELKDLAEELGVMPEEGSGADGAVLKEDIVAALEKNEPKAPPMPKIRMIGLYKNGDIGLQEYVGEAILDADKVYELPMSIIIKIEADDPQCFEFV